ncbi:uncharacterized protein LOC112017322 [Quercus suber]|uniref:uncharacterized protein LOC112017322 n=1 Tax=Quercus suber TaxID=58331 RepID=UPI0032DF89D6
MTRMFEPLLGKNIEIYVDNMVVKSKLVSEHLGDLGYIFDVLRKHRLRLNASKCSFGVGSGKSLGYIITHRGIEVDPDQIRAIQNLRPPQNPKEIQKLAGMITALNRFISRSADRCRPFYLLINKWKGFEWFKECAMAFQQLKEYLARPPIMSNPEADEVLYAYIIVVHHAVSLVLIRDDSGVQKPAYYVSKSLHEAEVKYLPLEKAILVVVHSTRKRPHYFQAHTVVVLTQLPLKSVLQAADYIGRIAKWNTAIKGQVLVDLMAEFAEPTIKVGAEGRIFDEKPVREISVPRSPCWKVYVDGAANQRGSGVGLVLVSPEDHVIEKSLRLGFTATNNEAECEAFLQGMVMVQKMGGKSVEIFSNSKLVVGQVKGEMEAKDSRMQEYLSQVKRLQSEFSPFNLSHIPKSGNSHADSLATLATSSTGSLPRIILVEHLKRAGEVVREAVPIHQVGVGPSWMDPITRFLKNDVLPEEKLKAEKIRRSASRYSTPAYPQGNGQAEAVNKVIVNGLKKRLDDAKGRWVEERPHVLWTYRTTPRRSTGKTPFAMTYGAEAVIPLETNFPTQRTSSFTPDSNDELLGRSLDLVDERREREMVQLAYYQQKLKQRYDANVKLRPLASGDLVLRKVIGATKNPSWGSWVQTGRGPTELP